MGILYSVSEGLTIYVGSGRQCNFIIRHADIAEVHLIIRPDSNNLTANLQVLGSSISINGRIIRKGNRSTIGKFDLIRLGGYLLIWASGRLYAETCFEGSLRRIITGPMIVEHRPVDARSVMADEKVFTPAVRKRAYMDLDSFEIEGPPPRRPPEKASIALAIGPAVTMAVPIVLGCGRAISAVTSGFAAAWAILNVVNRQRKIRNDEKRRRNIYREYIRECDTQISRRYDEYSEYMHSKYPVVAAYLSSGGNPFMMWNKDMQEDDYMKYRIGIGNVVFPVEIKIPKDTFVQVDDSLKELPRVLSSKYEMIDDIPIFVDFQLYRTVGIVYDDEAPAAAYINALIMQILVSHSPDICRISMRIEDEALYDKLKWIILSPNYNEMCDDMMAVILTDDTQYAASMQAVDNVKVILIKRQLSQLSAAVDCILFMRRKYNGIICLNDSGRKRIPIRFDELSDTVCSEYVRAMNLLWKSDGKVGEIPDNVGTGELFSQTIDADYVLRRWDDSDTTGSIGFPIGTAAGRETVYLDLNDKKHGAHGLIAGSTGSGKSELLTTIILSSSLSYPPDSLGFFLIDYKGGGMSNLFYKLPHLLGSISNLSESESNRAMQSMQSENMRRQRIFSENGINNIHDYTRAYKEGAVTEALPHIFIIIDEFAELKKEHPDFMQQLISIAAVGRSLGLHLILATQKPAGVIDDKIRSNSRFRICLRVEDRADSMDMLNKADAADISVCGRAYFQVGNDEIYKCFQSAYSMGRVYEPATNITIYDERLRKIDIPEHLSDTDDEIDKSRWFDMAMEAIVEADKQSEYSRPSALWLPSLPDKIGYIRSDEENVIIYGVADAPIWQGYIKAEYDYKKSGHLCFVGASQSGKSTALMTIIRGLAECKDAENMALYIIDYGGGQLEPFSELNNCGGYINPDVEARIAQLLLYIYDIYKFRQRLKPKIRKEQYSIFLIIDNYGEALKKYADQYEYIISDILKNGKALNIILIMTAGGVGPGEISAKYVDRIDTVVTLGLQDAYTQASILKTNTRMLPRINDNCGRAVTVIRDTPLETQICMPIDTEKEGKAGSEEIITNVITTENARIIKGCIDFPFIPDKADIEIFCDRVIRELKGAGGYRDCIPIGYEELTGRLYTVKLNDPKLILISGGRGSGKSNLLSVISIVAARLGINTQFISSVEVLVDFLHQTYDDSIILIIDNLDSILLDFYQKFQDKSIEKKICDLLDNTVSGGKNVTVFAVFDEKSRTQLLGKAIYESMLNKPYAICMGGGLEEQRMFDFSYIPYSKLCRKKKAGDGTVLKYDDSSFFGDVIFPRTILYDQR